MARATLGVMAVRIVLADDHRVVVEGFRALLTGEGFEVVGEANGGREVVPAVTRLEPDVLVLDLMMPDLGGLAVLPEVRATRPATKVVVLSMHAELAYVSQALRSGASAYVLKQAPSEELVRAIRAVTGGAGRYLSPPLSEAQLAEYEAKARTQAAALDPWDTLSGREREVLALAAGGLTNAEIADRLAIGRRTVETHRANLMRKLGLKSQAELVRYAVRRGLVSVE